MISGVIETEKRIINKTLLELTILFLIKNSEHIIEKRYVSMKEDNNLYCWLFKPIIVLLIFSNNSRKYSPRSRYAKCPVLKSWFICLDAIPAYNDGSLEY